MKISKIINYLTNVCEIGKGITGLHFFGGDMPFKLAHYINKKIELGSHHVSWIESWIYTHKPWGAMVWTYNWEAKKVEGPSD